MVVTAPHHTGNTFFEMLSIEDEDERIRVHKEARSNRPRDLCTAIDAVLSGGPWPEASPERIGVAGHSYGGWTALKMPRRDSRVKDGATFLDRTQNVSGQIWEFEKQ